MAKKLKNYIVRETYTIEVSLNAYNADEARDRFDKALFNLEKQGGKEVDGDFGFYVHDETYDIEESEIN